MSMKVADWKDVANSYYDKSMTLAILILLFTVMVFPKLEVKPYKKVDVVQIEVEETIPDVPPELKQQEVARQNIVETQVVIGEEGEDDEDLEVISTIETTVDAFEDVEIPSTNVEGSTAEFVVYQEAPKLLVSTEPEYPEHLRRFGISGQVYLRVEVFKDGTVGAVKVLKSLHPVLDQNAVDAVKKWKYKPAQNNGNPVSVWISFPVTYQL